MERNKALVVATVAAVSMVAASFGYAATRLVATTPDNVGKLAAKVDPSVQYVYEDVPAPPESQIAAPPADVQADEGRAEPSDQELIVAATDPEAPATTTTVGAAPSTTIAHEDHSHESTERHEAEDHAEPRDD